MRTLVPADSLVYLETNDLQAALKPIIDSKPFLEAAKSKPDFSALKGVQLAVAITGFETSEEKLTSEQSIGRIQPRFVAVAETHAWQFQTVRFAEQKLGSFVAEIYGSEPTLEESEKGGGHHLVWTAKDGRKAFAVVSRSLIYFGNDDSAIEKCLAVKRGEADSIAKAGKVAASAPETLASGYVGPDGIAQIASLIGLKFASEAGDESEVQSAIAGIVPQLIRGSITDVLWTMTTTEQGIEDKYQIGMPPEIAGVFVETMAPENFAESELPDYLPQGARTASIYRFRDPRVAWRSLLVIAQGLMSPSARSLIGPFSSALFEPYGIRNPDRFLGSVGPTIATANDAEDGEKSIVVTSILNSAELQESVAEDAVRLDGDKPTVPDDEMIGVSYLGGRVHIGEASTVVTSIAKERAKPEERKPYLREFLSGRNAPIISYSFDNKLPDQIRQWFGITTDGENANAYSTAITETRFTKYGIERRTVSDFGLIGSIIAQLNDN